MSEDRIIYELVGGKSRIRFLEIGGVKKSMKDWSKDPRCQISADGIRSRLKDGETNLVKAVFGPRIKPNSKARSTPGKRGCSPSWPKAEKQIMSDHYPDGGPDVCEDLLPNRSRQAIKRQANIMGLHMTKAAIAKGRRHPGPAQRDEVSKLAISGAWV